MCEMAWKGFLWPFGFQIGWLAGARGGRVEGETSVEKRGNGDERRNGGGDYG